MANLHMEGLGDAELLEIAEQALASLHTRFTDDEDRWEQLDATPAEAEAAAKAIGECCDRFDEFAELVREEKLLFPEST